MSLLAIPRLASQPATASKGVYFALNSSYSIAYAHPDKDGLAQLFMCRVLVGEATQGAKDIPVPPVRIEATQALYDTTTNLKEPPTIFVCYHDAQAYPEYLVTFKA